MVKRLVIETRGESSVFICECCKRPYLEIANGEVKIISKHGSANHENVLTIEHLRVLAVLITQQRPERW